MQRAIITLPLSPVKSEDFGRLVTPVVSETLGKILNANFYLCVNLLDSFKNREENFKKYVQTIDKSGIKYDSLWNDSQYIDKLLEQLEKLIKLGYVYEKDATVVRCDCGIVEIEKKNFETCNPDNTHYTRNGDDITCSHCNSKCHEYTGKFLVFDPTDLNHKKMNFLPIYLNKDIKTFENIILNSYTIISRMRDTGVNYTHNETVFNIDIDFLWGTYLSLFNEEEKVIICGNHELYQLFMVGAIEKCFNPESNSVFIGTPFIRGMKSVNLPCETYEDELIRKLLILFNIKWNRKEKDFDETVLIYLKKISYKKLVKLYDIICHDIESQNNSFYELVNDAMYERINMQYCVKELKN